MSRFIKKGDNGVLYSANGYQCLEKLYDLEDIEVSNDMEIIVDGKSNNLYAGEQNEILDLFIKDGVNKLVFNGNGEVKISYVGGEL